MQTTDQMVDQENMHKIGLLSLKCSELRFFSRCFWKASWRARVSALNERVSMQSLYNK